MNGIQSSMDNFLGRFENAVTLLQNDNDYLPTRLLIQKAELLVFVAKLHQSNNNVSLLQVEASTLRTKRHNMAFKSTSQTPGATIEAVMMNVLHYIGAENGQEHSIYKAIKAYLAKMRPKTKTKKEDGSKSPSRSEKTYTALAGFFEHIVHLITNATNLVYTPSNASLQINTLLSLATDFAQLNKDIASAERDESEARTARQALYKGENGAKDLTKYIKMYLMSYVGGRENPKYQQFVSALG